MHPLKLSNQFSLKATETRTSLFRGTSSSSIAPLRELLLWLGASSELLLSLPPGKRLRSSRLVEATSMRHWRCGRREYCSGEASKGAFAVVDLPLLHGCDVRRLQGAAFREQAAETGAL